MSLMGTMTGKIMFHWSLIFLAFSFALSCESNQPNAVSSLPSPSPSPSPSVAPGVHVIKTTENNKYQLEAVFSGEDLLLVGQIHKVIEAFTVRSMTTSESVKYSRADGPAEEDMDAYFTDVWSPDNEWLVLPLHRFGGFCVIRARDALATIKKQRCTDNPYVRLSTASHELLWHDFEKWDGDAAFVFKAGLDGNNTRLKYDIPTGRLTVLDPDASPRFIEARNAKGKIAIEHIR